MPDNKVDKNIVNAVKDKFLIISINIKMSCKLLTLSDDDTNTAYEFSKYNVTMYDMPKTIHNAMYNIKACRLKKYFLNFFHILILLFLKYIIYSHFFQQKL